MWLLSKGIFYSFQIHHQCYGRHYEWEFYTAKFCARFFTQTERSWCTRLLLSFTTLSVLYTWHVYLKNVLSSVLTSMFILLFFVLAKWEILNSFERMATIASISGKKKKRFCCCNKWIQDEGQLRVKIGSLKDTFCFIRNFIRTV